MPSTAHRNKSVEVHTPLNALLHIPRRSKHTPPCLRPQLTHAQLRHPSRQHHLPILHRRHRRLPRAASPTIRHTAVESVPHLLRDADGPARSPRTHLPGLAGCARERAVLVEWGAGGRKQMECALPAGGQLCGGRIQHAIPGAEDDERDAGAQASG